jgi:hypothetical protein
MEGRVKGGVVLSMAVVLPDLRKFLVGVGGRSSWDPAISAWSSPSTLRRLAFLE